MRRFGRTTLITVGCCAVLAGLGLAKLVGFSYGQWMILLAPLVLLLKNKSLTSLLLAVLIGLAIGLARGSVYVDKLNQIRSLAKQHITITATASSDAVYAKGSQLEFTATDIRLVGRSNQPLDGKFKISGFGVPMVYRGDRVRASGKLYLTLGANQAGISFAQLEIVASANQPIAKISRSFATGMENALPEPQASFGLGILVGQRTNLPQQIIQQLTMVGLVHIVAVSGYNLTILVRGLQRLRIKSKYQRTLLSLILIGLFVLMTGFSASIVRAAVISVLSLWAGYYGREIKPLLLIAFAAALTGWIRPYYVWSDIGWYLSFLAFFGVLVIAPLITSKLFSKQPKLLAIVLIETLCAELMTLPLIMAIFGQMSLIGLLANLLIVPLIPVAMLLSAIAALSGVLLPSVAGWLALPAALLLTYILDIVHILSQLPSIFLHVSIDSLTMISLYAVLALAVLVGYKRSKSSRLVEVET